jgi:hypothetical protein
VEVNPGVDKILRRKQPTTKRRAAEPRLQVLVRLSPKLMKALDAFCARNLDSPTRPEAIRRLLAQGLMEEAGKSGKL